MAAGNRPAQYKLMDGNRERAMLWFIFILLLVLWLLGVVTAYTMNGLIHLLLVVAVVVLLINLLSGRRAV